MWKKALKIAAAVFVLFIVLLVARKSYKDSHYFDNYDPNAPLNITIQETQEINKETPDKGYTLTKFTFDGYNGEKVPTLMSVPLVRKARKFPVIVFLHGIGQNKNFLKDITMPFNQAGFIFTSFDQYMQGERKLPKDASPLEGARAFMQRPAKTINEARRLIDFLSDYPDVDPSRIYLVGASYGAITGTTVMAKDKRIRAGILVYGGADLGKLIDSVASRLGIASGLGMIKEKISPEKPPLPKLTTGQNRVASIIIGGFTPIARYFLGVSDPIHYAGQITMPVYLQNGKFDVLVPAPAGEALQKAVKNPTKITWYESDHVGINIEQTKQVLRDGLQWLVDQDNPVREPQEQLKELAPFEVQGL